MSCTRHGGRHGGQEAGFVCNECRDAIMGLQPSQVSSEITIYR